MVGAALLVPLLALPAPDLISNTSLGQHIDCSCTTKSLEVDCECDDIPVLKSIGFEADIDAVTTKSTWISSSTARRIESST